MGHDHDMVEEVLHSYAAAVEGDGTAAREALEGLIEQVRHHECSLPEACRRFERAFPGVRPHTA